MRTAGGTWICATLTRTIASIRSLRRRWRETDTRTSSSTSFSGNTCRKETYTMGKFERTPAEQQEAENQFLARVEQARILALARLAAKDQAQQKSRSLERLARAIRRYTE